MAGRGRAATLPAWMTSDGAPDHTADHTTHSASTITSDIPASGVNTSASSTVSSSVSRPTFQIPPSLTPENTTTAKTSTVPAVPPPKLNPLYASYMANMNSKFPGAAVGGAFLKAQQAQPKMSQLPPCYSGSLPPPPPPHLQIPPGCGLPPPPPPHQYPPQYYEV